MEHQELKQQVEKTIDGFHATASKIISERIKYREIFIQHLAHWYDIAADELTVQLEYGHLNAKFSVTFDHTMYNLSLQELRQCVTDFKDSGKKLPKFSVSLQFKNAAPANPLQNMVSGVSSNPWASDGNIPFMSSSVYTIEFFVSVDSGDPEITSIWKAMSGDAAGNVLSGLFERPIKDVEKDVKKLTKTELKSMVGKSFKWNYTFSHEAIKNVISGMVNPILNAKGFRIYVVDTPLFLSVQLEELV